MKQLTGFIVAGIVGGLIVLGGIVFIVPSLTTNNSTALNSEINIPSKLVSRLVSDKMNVGKDVPNNFIAAAEKAMPTVVHIRSMQKASGEDDENYNLFKDFFGEGNRGGGTGSGVIIKENGYIVTNNHVIEGADELEVTLFDNRKFKAKLIGRDPTTDLAVLKIDATDLPKVAYGNSDKAKVGEWVLAVGNPFNLTSTVTAGIISAKGRNIDILENQYKIESFIQTDAAVNPGNSGGALIDINGDLLGINTAIASSTGSFAGYSFAIPVDFVSKIVDDLIKHGEVKRGFLGISIQDLDYEIANDLGLGITEGVHVIEVNSEGAASVAGLKPNDIIVGVNSTKIKNAPKLQEMIGRGRPGDQVKILVNRDGKEKTFDVTLKE